MSSSSRRCLLLLKKCKNMKQLKQVHGQAITCGLGNNGFALSRLLHFCSDPLHGCLTHAWKLFQHIQLPTICIYNTIIKAFLLKDQYFYTFHIYNNMLRSKICPDEYTLPYMLRACAKLQTCYLGELVHGCCLKIGLVFNEFVGNALITMYCAFENLKAARYVFDENPSLTTVSWTIMISGYAKVGDVVHARLLFDEAPVKDRGIWGAMISGYVHNNCFKECLYIFRLMQLTVIEPDEGIFVSILCACAHLGALDSGIWIHGYLDRVGLPLSVRLGTGLIDMYAKCGNLDLANRVFDGMRQRDTVCWNVMISGLAMHGDGEGALKLFLEMEKTGFRPDNITFIAVFTACSYSGMSHEGLSILDRMCNVYNIELASEHYGCVVDLLSRAGFLEEAKKIIQGMPNSATPSEEAIAWRALLTACCNQRKVQLAEVAAERLVQLELHSGVYVLLSNLYAACGKHDDAKRIRKMMRNRGVDKTPGCSSVKVNGVISEFVAGEKANLQMEIINMILMKIDKQLEYSG
ncbi:PPR domain-containing protein/PPR_2 domain-containing protein [Cephalotus follicularis]|uniref:PPR domain-containing protein/PPR_2 domain-containing protein n=1 Tax=Cephalotus follicularis TaxID=3775 RepID=A0A1Q3C3C5_CEPFO|nr:PPR domain-containing protein/PPR_2 domain-containing protein [Cephalotus follicularis]